MTTCVPVKMDDGRWRAAVFFELGGKACKVDRDILSQCSAPLPIGLEGDVIETATAALVMLRFEIMTDNNSPLAGEVLVAPGMGSVQFDTMKHLGQQRFLDFYFADAKYHVIYSQQLALGEPERAGYRSLLEDAVNHDAVIRLTGRYDARKAYTEVVANYVERV